MISSGFAIVVLLAVKDIAQVGLLHWGWIMTYIGSPLPGASAEETSACFILRDACSLAVMLGESLGRAAASPSSA
jgi:hypothetical protein